MSRSHDDRARDHRSGDRSLARTVVVFARSSTPSRGAVDDDRARGVPTRAGADAARDDFGDARGGNRRRARPNLYRGYANAQLLKRARPPARWPCGFKAAASFSAIACAAVFGLPPFLFLGVDCLRLRMSCLFSKYLRRRVCVVESHPSFVSHRSSIVIRACPSRARARRPPRRRLARLARPSA